MGLVFGLAALTAGLLHPIRLTECVHRRDDGGCSSSSVPWAEAVSRVPLELVLPFIALLLPAACAAYALRDPGRLRPAATLYVIVAAGLAAGTQAAWTLPGALAMVGATLAAGRTARRDIAIDLGTAGAFLALAALAGYALGNAVLVAAAAIAGVTIGLWLPLRLPVARSAGAAILSVFIPWSIATVASRVAQTAGIVDSPKRALLVLLPVFVLLAYIGASLASRIVLRRRWDEAFAIPVYAGAAWLVAAGAMFASGAIA